MSPTPSYTKSIFVNCPFDDRYQPLFRALVFTVFHCDYVACCALEIDDASEVRIDKICGLIGRARFGIHDLSRTELDTQTGLPRFNMPLELGIFLGAKRFGDKRQQTKPCLVLDTERYRYQAFISDIAGQDVYAHHNDPQRVIRLVRDWLSTSSKRKTIPGGAEIARRYKDFLRDLPEFCQDLKIQPDEMTFTDYTNIVSEWLRAFGN